MRLTISRRTFKKRRRRRKKRLDHGDVV